MHPLPSAFSALALIAFAAPLLADCPPLGKLPGYVLEDGSPALRAFDEHVFLRGNQDEQVETPVAGRACRATYTFPSDDGSPMSDAEIQMNYREQLRALGAQVTFARDRDTHARLDKAGTQTWFHVYSQEDMIELVVIGQGPHATALSKPGAGDHRLLGRMPGYALREQAETRTFDEVDFQVLDAEGTSSDVMVQGARHSVSYAPADDGAIASDLDIHLAYRSAIRALGGEILRAEKSHTTARVLDGGQVTWVKVYSQEDLIELTAVDEKPFASSLQPPAASVLKSALEADGRVALYIDFDFAKATLRPAADAVIAQVLALLQGDPALRLAIEGHTDDVGSDAANEALSRDRAAAVVGALVARGVEAGRLQAVGFGEAKPIAGNETSEGRARNRRVELVRR